MNCISIATKHSILLFFRLEYTEDNLSISLYIQQIELFLRQIIFCNGEYIGY
jgi:hypothetical protein